MQHRRADSEPNPCRAGWPGVLLGIFFLLAPVPALAEGIRGIVNWNYSHLDSVISDNKGNEVHEELRSFVQLYNLNLQKDIMPLLKLSVGGIVQKNDSDVILINSRQTSVTTLTRPNIDLTLNSQLLNMGAGFNRVNTESTTSGLRLPTMVSDAYRGYIGWKPSELPTLDLMMTRTNNYDKERALENMTTDQVSLFSRYDPTKTIQLQYKGSTVDTRDRINGVDTTINSNGGRITYDDRFFKDRVTVSSYYDVNYSSIETIASSGTGSVKAPVLAFEGLFALTTLPEHDPLHPMVPTPFLIDNDVAGTNNNAINIGSAPYTTVPQQDTSPRNIGLRFGTLMEMNNLVVYVYSLNNTGVPTYLNSSPTGLVPNQFKWDIYLSTDNQTWRLYQTMSSAPYEPVAALPGVGRFELSMPAVKTQYIKVVVSPLTLTGDAFLFPIVAVTELQAFMELAASEVQRKSRGMNQTLSLYTKFTLLDNPNLYYDISYLLFESSSGASTLRRSTLSNGLSLSHRFNQVFSGVVRTERLDANEPAPLVNSVTYNTTASVQAVPLPTLRHTAAYGFNLRETPTGRTNTNSLYLTNSADLYRNITAFLNAGWSLVDQETNQTNKTSTYAYGINLMPRKTLTMTLSATSEVSTQSGGGFADYSLVTRRQDGSIAYIPFSTLYLTAGISKIVQPTFHDTTKNYGINWSPFPGGALQFGFSYNESLSSRDNALIKITQPSLRWTIARWASLDASYYVSDSSSTQGSILTRGTTVNFNAIF